MKSLLSLAIIIGLAYFLYSFIGVDNDDSQITREYPTGEFSGVRLEGPYEVELRQGATPKLEIRASEKVHDLLKVYSQNQMLAIELPDKLVVKKKSIKIYLTVKNLDKISITGSVKVETPEPLQVDNLKLEFTGAGEVNLDVNARKVISEINGVGSFWLSGTTDYHRVNFSGVGNYSAKNLVSKYTSVDSDGVGNVEVYASEKFIGHASGIGSVKYFGQPKDVSVNASGIGKVNREQ